MRWGLEVSEEIKDRSNDEAWGRRAQPPDPENQRDMEGMRKARRAEDDMHAGK